MLFTHITTVLLFSGLTLLAVIDWRTRRLPDLITLPLIAAGLGINLVSGTAPIATVLGAVLGYASLVAVELAFRYLRGIDALGRGDAKLFAAGGAWCTAWLLPQIALIGSASALVFVLIMGLIRGRAYGRLEAIAFGPWLIVGIAACWIWRAYLGGFPPLGL